MHACDALSKKIDAPKILMPCAVAPLEHLRNSLQAA
jgi:hypothetical protein